MGDYACNQQNASTDVSDVPLPLPKNMHLELTESDIAGRPVMIIGDVHGCLDELKLLLNNNAFNSNKSIVIFCGDMINKGPKNCETLAYVRNLGDHVYAVRGNHEEHVLKHWHQYSRDKSYELKAKYKWIEDLTIADIDFLHDLPYTISMPSLNAIVVHAGLFPGRPLHEQDCADILFMRNIDFSSGTPQSSKQSLIGDAWGTFWPGPQHVYYGHDAKRRLQQYAFATCLDTGCVYGGKLTAQVIAPVSKLVSVTANKIYRDPKKS